MKHKMILAILILAAAAASAQTITKTDCEIHGTGNNTASASCTSTSEPDLVQQHTDALNAARQAREQANDEALGANMANFISQMQAAHAANKEAKQAAKQAKQAAEQAQAKCADPSVAWLYNCPTQTQQQAVAPEKAESR